MVLFGHKLQEQSFRMIIWDTWRSAQNGGTYWFRVSQEVMHSLENIGGERSMEGTKLVELFIVQAPY